MGHGPFTVQIHLASQLSQPRPVLLSYRRDVREKVEQPQKKTSDPTVVIQWSLMVINGDINGVYR